MIAPTRCAILAGEGGPSRLADRPGLIETLLWELARFGFERAVLLAEGSASPLHAAARLAGPKFGIEVETAAGIGQTGSAGALRGIGPPSDDAMFLVDDRYAFDFNILDLIPLLASIPSASVAMALRRPADGTQAATLNLENERFIGVSEPGGATAPFSAAGVFLVRTSALAGFAERGSFEHDVLPQLVARGLVCGRDYDSAMFSFEGSDRTASEARPAWTRPRRPAIFFDRDGVLNQDHGYVGDIGRFHWTKTAITAVKLVNDRGYFAFVVTNQSGVARGYFDEDAVRRVHKHMQCELRAHGAHLDAIRFCPHHPDGVVERFAKACACRKPRSGMVLDLLDTWPVDVERSLLVGDKPGDLAAAQGAGIAAVRFDGSDLEAMLRSHLQSRRA